MSRLTAGLSGRFGVVVGDDDMGAPCLDGVVHLRAAAEAAGHGQERHELQRKAHSYRRIRVERGIAHLKNWRSYRRVRRSPSSWQRASTRISTAGPSARSLTSPNSPAWAMSAQRPGLTAAVLVLLEPAPAAVLTERLSTTLVLGSILLLAAVTVLVRDQ